MGLQRYKLFLFYQINFKKREKKHLQHIWQTTLKPFTINHFAKIKISSFYNKKTYTFLHLHIFCSNNVQKNRQVNVAESIRQKAQSYCSE